MVVDLLKCLESLAVSKFRCCILRRTWPTRSTQVLLDDLLVAELLNKFLWWHDSANSWYEVFVPICVVVHYVQTSPFLSHLSRGNCSRILVVCSDATLVFLFLLFFFVREKTFLLAVLPYKTYLFSLLLIVLS